MINITWKKVQDNIGYVKELGLVISTSTGGVILFPFVKYIDTGEIPSIRLCCMCLGLFFICFVGTQVYSVCTEKKEGARGLLLEDLKIKVKHNMVIPFLGGCFIILTSIFLL